MILVLIRLSSAKRIVQCKVQGLETPFLYRVWYLKAFRVSEAFFFFTFFFVTVGVLPVSSAALNIFFGTFRGGDKCNAFKDDNLVFGINGYGHHFGTK